MLATATPATTSPYTRLHITPLDADLVKIVLSTTVLPKAQNISYHSLETFPEKRYGFIDLPNEDAEKLKKKFHGSVLRGVKMRVEAARPPTIPEPMGDAALATDDVPKREKKSKKDKPKTRKRDGEELVGIELEDGRKVKRGWTVTEESSPRKDKRDKSSKEEKKKEKRKTRSKYTNHEECLVRTILPAKSATTTTAEAAAGDDESNLKKKKKYKSREVVIHEFEKTTKFPTFLKSSDTSYKPKQLEFVDGKGWVDEAGAVVEPVAASSRPKPTEISKPRKAAPLKKTPEAEDESSSSGDESSEDDPSLPNDNEKDASGSEAGSSLGGSEKGRFGLPDLSDLPSSPLALKSDSRPKSSGSMRNLTIKIPPAGSPTTPVASKVHPLEALYKRPKDADGNVVPESDSKGFSFFGNEEVEEEGETPLPAPGSQPPATPFSSQEFEFRNTRSAAPTPDTAHPSRTFKPWAHNEAEDNLDEDADEDEGHMVPDDEEDEEMEDVDVPPAAAGADQSSSDFQSWFWEHRGDLNRSWKQRRKLMAKEKRYRENKSRAERAI